MNLSTVISYVLAAASIVHSIFGRFDIAAYLMAFAIWMGQ